MNAKTLSATLGVLLILAGILGFVIPDLLGMHLTLAHNIVHLASGILALFIGVSGTLAATRTFCILFGLVYGLLGVAGLLTNAPDKMLTVIPNQLMFGMRDHIVHVVLGGLFLVAGLARRPVHTTVPVNR